MFTDSTNLKAGTNMKSIILISEKIDFCYFSWTCFSNCIVRL